MWARWIIPAPAIQERAAWRALLRQCPIMIPEQRRDAEDAENRRATEPAVRSPISPKADCFLSACLRALCDSAFIPEELICMDKAENPTNGAPPSILWAQFV